MMGIKWIPYENCGALQIRAARRGGVSMALRTPTGEVGSRARPSGSDAEYEDTYAACTFICGIDEVGRGPLAGVPVVAGATVILPVDCEILF